MDLLRKINKKIAFGNKPKQFSQWYLLYTFLYQELISSPGVFCLFWTKASGFFCRKERKGIIAKSVKK